MTSTATDTGSAATAEVLAVLRGHKADREAADIAMAEATIEWALLNEADPAECVGFFADKALPVAGAGAPLVSEFALMEYAAALGVTTESGRRRSAGSWSCATASRACGTRAGGEAAVVAGRPDRRADHLPARGRCRACGPAPGPGGALVFVGAAGPPGRGGDGAVRPRSRRSEAPGSGRARHVDVPASTRSPSTARSRSTPRSTWPTPWTSRTPSAPARKQQADLGSTESLDVRRSIALGDLARRQLAFGFDTDAPGRSVVLYAAPLRGDRSAGVATPGPRSAWSRSRNGAATRPGHREAGDRPGRAHPRRGLRSPRPAQGPERPGRRALRVPALHQTSQAVRHRPRHPLRRRRHRPAPTTPRRCADATTAPRPTARGTTPSWTAAPTSGPPPTASG